jgi:hypothetical protein
MGEQRAQPPFRPQANMKANTLNTETQRHRESQKGNPFDVDVAFLRFVGADSCRDDSVINDRISSL